MRAKSADPGGFGTRISWLTGLRLAPATAAEPTVPWEPPPQRGAWDLGLSGPVGRERARAPREVGGKVRHPGNRAMVSQRVRVIASVLQIPSREVPAGEVPGGLLVRTFARFCPVSGKNCTKVARPLVLRRVKNARRRPRDSQFVLLRVFRPSAPAFAQRTSSRAPISPFFGPGAGIRPAGGPEKPKCSPRPARWRESARS